MITNPPPYGFSDNLAGTREEVDANACRIAVFTRPPA